MVDPGFSRKTRQLKENAQFRWLFAGNTALFFGFFGTMLLRSLLVWDITGDEMALAAINLLAALGMFTTSLVSGALIDRHERKRFLVLAQLTIVAAEAMILLLLVLGKINYTALMLSAAAASVAFPFIMPSRTAMLVSAVERSVLARATALMSAGVNAARMISPAVIGVLADRQGFVFCYAVVLSLHSVSLLCTFSLQRSPPPDGHRDSLLREMLTGFTYIIRHRSLGLCILFGVLPLLIVIPLQQLLVVFVDDIWQAGGSGLGIMLAATGVGGVAGSLAMTLVPDRSLVAPMLVGTFGVGAVLLLFGHIPMFWLAVVAVFSVYAASVLTQTAVQVAVQFMAEDFVRGRVTTIMMTSISIAPMGTMLLAYGTRELGAAWAITLAGAALLVATGLFWALLPDFRRIDAVCSRAGG